MKKLFFLPIVALMLLTSCATVRVNADYDKKVDFSAYKTYAFLKSGIDKVQISDLDKRRILTALDAQLQAKGFTKSDNPDMLINFFTKEQEQVNVNNYGMGFGYGWGWGFSPFYGGTYVNRYTEGTLYIDLIDAKRNELVWQGQGVGVLTQRADKKDELIQNFVTKILEQYPPQQK